MPRSNKKRDRKDSKEKPKDERKDSNASGRQAPNAGKQARPVIEWPLLQMDFRMACYLCFVKQHEGQGGSLYTEDLSHYCGHDMLIIRTKDSPHLSWLRIRVRPADVLNSSYSMVCKLFQRGMQCDGVFCRLPHNHYEMKLWELDRSGVFNIQNFLLDVQQRKIYSSNTPGLDIREPQKMDRSDDQPKKFIPTQPKVDTAESSIPTPRRPNVGRRIVSVNYNALHSSSTTSPLQTECGLFCSSCLFFSGTQGFYNHMPRSQHKCFQTLLAFQLYDNQGQILWALVRERDRHKDFGGRYAMCRSALTGDPEDCGWGETCHFAHSSEEKLIWTLEQEGRFDISEFISKCRNQGLKRTAPVQENLKPPSIQSILQRFGGFFTFICRNCFFEKSRIIMADTFMRACLGPEKHHWQSSKVMAHCINNKYTVIDERKFNFDGAYYQMCWFKEYCRYRRINRCRFAHSEIEITLWKLEQTATIERDVLVQRSKGIHQVPLTQARPTAWGVRSTSTPSQTLHQVTSRPPVNIIQVCGTCWGNKLQSEETRANKCIRGHHNFQLLSVCISQPSRKLIRRLPGHIKDTTRLSLCRFRLNCHRQYCGFPHENEEMLIWKWMLINGVRDLRVVCSLCVRQVGGTAPPQSRNGTSTQSNNPWITVTDRHHHVPKPAEPYTEPAISEFYCQICGTSFVDSQEWDEHCISEQHQDNINSDKEHSWDFRPPPWSRGSNLELCLKHLHNKSCQCSFVPDMYNFCPFAHSEEELEEWRKRYEWREMKRAMLADSNMFSYTENLLDEYNNQKDGAHVMSEEIAGVEIYSDEKDFVYILSKNDIFTWTFQIHSQIPIQKVAMLHNRDRMQFHLVDRDGEQHQIAPGDLFLDIDDGGRACYTIQVNFSGNMFGSFSQWMVCDFESRPVLVKKLSVECGEKAQLEKVQHIREQLKSERWTSDNHEIIRCPRSQAVNDFNHMLLTKYKEPTGSETVVTSDSLTDLNRNNYTHKMHQLIQLEEITRQKIIASFNLCCDVKVSQFVDEQATGMGFFIGRNGDLFVKVIFTENVFTDSRAGALLFSSMRSALVKRADSSKKRVYEIFLMDESNYGFDGRGKDYLYLVVHAEAAEGLCVSPGLTVTLEIQFQMDRRVFCKAHYAVDSLRSMDIVFPDVVKYKPDVKMLQQMATLRYGRLNQDQLTAVRHILVPQKGHLAPFIMYGPFGTGKTETLAQVTLSLLATQQLKCRILICTHSNSAADLYITKFLYKFLKEHKFTMLRIISKERWLSTLPEKVREFCCTPDDLPPKEELENINLILTTVETSLVLTELGMHGAFTHIFVDEAGQIMECEILMPLCLANSKTCVVLAGDHLQIGPTVYSEEAKHQKLDMSLLERLFNYYMQVENSGVPQLTQKYKQSPLTVFLKKNYRTHAEILKFISASFYNGPNNLEPCSNEPSLVDFPPMMFYAVQGKEYQRDESTSYLNNAEAQELVERIKELLDYWPSEWGERDASQVAVITTYKDQIKHIRVLLRHDESRPYLRDVKVETIHSFQGREVKALFITTVRTTNLLNEPHLVSLLEAGRDIGDLGFLSSHKLLNTALTRTRSFVAVVGDPVALCLIGECTTIWKTYIKECSQLGAIIPYTYTYDAIRNAAIRLQHGPAKRVLDMLSKQKEIISSSGNDVRSFAAETSSEEKGNLINSSATQPTQSENGGKILKEKLVNRKSNRDELPLRVLNHQTELTESMAISNKGILLSLAEECMKQKPSTKITKKVAVDPNDVILVSGKEDLIFVSSDTSTGNISDDQKKEPFSVSLEEDFEIYTLKNSNDEVVEIYENWGKEKVGCHISAEPGKYFKCMLNVKSRRLAIATVLSMGTKNNDPILIYGQKIEICGSLRRGHAMDGDTVVVEIVDFSHNGPLQGQVKGILEQAMDPRDRLYVCSADAENIGTLSPLDVKMPLMHSLASRSHERVARKGHICVYKISNSDISFSHYAKVDLDAPESLLFVVRYMFWPAGFLMPCGLVVGAIKMDQTGNSFNMVKDIEYKSTKPLPESVLQEAGKMMKSIPDKMPGLIADRLDMTAEFCFTVGEADRLEQQLTVNVKETEDGYEVGLHVPDVAAFIDKDSALDRLCMSYRANMFSTNEGSQGVPFEAKNYLYGLVSAPNHFALSLILTVDGNGMPCKNLKVLSTVINSKRHFSYDETETVLQSQSANIEERDYYKSCLIVLDQLTCLWKEQRLGKNYILADLKLNQRSTPNTYIMMNELKLKFGAVVAQLLLSVYPLQTPLLTKPPPEVKALDVWRKANVSSALNSTHLTRAFLDDQVCCCDGPCTCVFEYIRQHKLDPGKSISMFRDIWYFIDEAVYEEPADFAKIEGMVSQPDCVPQVWLSTYKLTGLQPQSLYRCSGVLLEPKSNYHFDFGLKAYTSFANPENCYIDLAVQRMLTALVSEAPSPYTTEEMNNLCVSATANESRVSHLEQTDFLFNLCLALQKQPIVLPALVVELDSQRFKLNFGPQFSELPDIIIALNKLPMARISGNVETEMQLHWKEKHCLDVHGKSHHNNNCDLNFDSLLCEIPSIPWQRLLVALRESDDNHMCACIQEISTNLVTKSLERGETLAVQDQPGEAPKFCEVRYLPIDLYEGQVLAVQLSGDKQHICSTSGIMLAPQANILQISENHSMCLEHRQDPHLCFTSNTTSTGLSMQQKHTDIDSYMTDWLLPTLAIESAHKAVCGRESFIIDNVKIVWFHHDQKLVGMFTLSKEFCKQISLDPDKGIGVAINLLDDTSAYCEDANFCLDYLCIRLMGLQLDQLPNMRSDVGQVFEQSRPVIWVGHCRVVEVQKTVTAFQVKTVLMKSNMELPDQVLVKESDANFTVEWIEKDDEHRILDTAARGLGNTSDFVKNVVIGKKPLDSVDPVPPEPRQKVLLEAQENLISDCMRKSFVAIIGGPGTGKSTVAACLSFMMVNHNAKIAGLKKHETPGQLMVCAPTEESLDVITGFLLRMKNVTDIVRVYSEDVEDKDFPIPGKPISHSQISSRSIMEKVALHHIIRTPRTLHGKYLQEQEELLHTSKGSTLPEFEVALERAQTHQLKRAQIVLCTCYNSARLILRQTINVKQIIIDDAGLIPEVESIVPLVAHKNVKQLILLGDLKMPRREMGSRLASHFGLARPLLQRYADNARVLNIQCRSNKALATFVKKLFYNNLDTQVIPSQQSTAQSIGWFAQSGLPCAFLNVQGEESRLNNCMEGLTGEAVENQQEATTVSLLVAALIRQHKIEPSAILVITATVSQAKLLKSLIKSNITICLPLESVGREAKYVILSTVRSMPLTKVQQPVSSSWIRANLGCMANTRIVNLVTSRARAAFFICGNQDFLSLSQPWQSLLAAYRHHKCIVNDVRVFLQ